MKTRVNGETAKKLFVVLLLINSPKSPLKQEVS